MCYKGPRLPSGLLPALWRGRSHNAPKSSLPRPAGHALQTPATRRLAPFRGLQPFPWPTTAVATWEPDSAPSLWQPRQASPPSTLARTCPTSIWATQGIRHIRGVSFTWLMIYFLVPGFTQWCNLWSIMKDFAERESLLSYIKHGSCNVVWHTGELSLLRV